MEPLPATRRRRATAAVSATLLLAALLAALAPAPVRAQVPSGYGAGVFEVEGSSRTTIALAVGGTYYLIVAADNSSTYVWARIYYNTTTLEATLNESGPAAALVSLAPGNYSLVLVGHGRAALGWDFTDGSVQDFPDNVTATGFLRPASGHVEVVVSLGNAQEIHLEVYDDHLLPVTDANVTASGAVPVDLPAAHATSALLVARVVIGEPQGVFGLAWTSVPLSAPAPDLLSQLLPVAFWIGVPVVLALLAFVLLRRRSRFP